MPLALDRQALAEEQEEEVKVLPSTPSYWQPQEYRGRTVCTYVGTGSIIELHVHQMLKRMQLVAYRCGSTSSANMRLDCM